MLIGADFSHFDGSINWKNIPEIGFAFLKATDGLAFVDPLFSKNWEGSDAVGIPRGAYHFFRPNSDGFNQANHFLKTVSPSLSYEGDLPPVLDLEVIGQFPISHQIESALNWLVCVEKMTKRIPIVYTNPDTIGKLENSPLLKDFPLWLAEYDSEAHVPAPWSKWTFWQYTDSGRITGIIPTVDLNHFDGDKQDLLRL